MKGRFMLYRITLLALFCISLNACTTRQIGTTYGGSTEQRLITHSIEKLMAQLPVSEFASFRQRTVLLNSHFIQRNDLLDYADQMLRMELVRRFEVVVTDDAEQADYQLDFFFTSLGTDTDSYGLSIPIINVSNAAESARLDVLAVDMYHGISECLYYVRDLKEGTLKKHGKLLARIRTDEVSTPIINFPISNID
ncbi:hypothetical protein QSV34_13770 [Porticoccus sp. W117]|uniref:hypothetical protein n=1 Tax=Porticoccus sp. W117 TaxID=3054777 RepID=UPI002597A66E|nr:hypothetical protein [Porticoccus sp. W117]MDM3872415.1 hypothetical protein [Porticoccus sp. W117]